MTAISEICINGRGASTTAGARVLVFIGRAAEYVRAASCGKAGALLGEATARHDARDAAWRLARARW